MRHVGGPLMNNVVEPTLKSLSQVESDFEVKTIIIKSILKFKIVFVDSCHQVKLAMELIVKNIENGFYLNATQ